MDDEACGRVRQHVGMHVLCGSLLKLRLQHRLVAILGLISRLLGLPRIGVSCLVLSLGVHLGTLGMTLLF